jgi:hypothetical protein
MSEAIEAQWLDHVPDQNPDQAPPKKPGRASNRRPKQLPARVRERLAHLGLVTRSHGTNNDNLRDLVDRLTAGIEQYSKAADHWQKKTLALHNAEKQGHVESFAAFEGQETGIGRETSQHRPPSFFSPSDMDMLVRLHRAATPGLSETVLPEPYLRSTLETIPGLTINETFFKVLKSVGSMGRIFGMFKETPGAWSAISRLKPNFSEGRARQIWDDMFTSINTPISSLQWHATSRVRSNEWDEDDIDPDYDQLDRILSRSSDADVLDILHYTSLLLLGLNTASMELPQLIEARDHLGRQMERLLHEAIVLRNISSNRLLVAQLVCSVVDSMFHFSFQAKAGALGSLLEIAWATCSQNRDLIHPILQSMIVLESTIWAPNNARRAVWMARNEELIKKATEPYFFLMTTTCFTTCFYSLAIRDEETLLRELDVLDTLLSPEKTKQESSDSTALSGPYFADPTTTLYNMPSSDSFSSSSSPTYTGWSTSRTELDGMLKEFSSESSSSPIADFGMPLDYGQLDMGLEPYDDQTRTCLRATIPFLRAEAAIISKDYETCYYWVDEADKEIQKLEDPILMRKFIMTEVSGFPSNTDPDFHFPSGCQSVCDELERRGRERCFAKQAVEAIVEQSEADPYFFDNS